jgi:predicted aldo/keto reductase-like oxidoreductase
MSPQIKYAHKTHNTWVYRRTYPKALQPLLGTALKQSLKTSDATQAKARVAELNQTFTTIIKEAQTHALATPSHRCSHCYPGSSTGCGVARRLGPRN